MVFKYLRLVSFLLLAAVFVQPVSAKELDSKLESTARKLTEAAAARKITAGTLAVFPFQADEKLSKKKVNFAVSEMLTANFLKQRKFKVMERAQLEEVMKEQKLGLSGAVDSKTAADIGKLAGAKLLVLGNVIQVGNSYQLTSKLVDSETGEIITSEIVEVPVKTFDEDAERYLVLVPDTQAIGIYLETGVAPVTGKKLPAVTTPGGTTFTPLTTVSFFDYSGVGVKYFFSPKWMVDAFLGLGANFKSSDGETKYTLSKGVISKDGNLGDWGTENSIVRVSVSRVSTLSDKFRLYTGGGVLQLKNTYKGDRNKADTVYFTGSSASVWYLGKKTGQGYTYATPFVRLGLEWRPKTRLGISLCGTYNLLKKDYKGYTRVQDLTGGNPTGETDILTQQFTFPQIQMQGQLALYF